jgi:mono/diheme cytochrome c family protein
MTCSACHTRQISADGKEYRIDGGPALVDFYKFLVDLDDAVKAVLHDDTTFLTFARAALGVPAPTPGEIATLHDNVQAWYLRFNTLRTRGLPNTPWGLGRLDAVGMIFNRLTGLDIGKSPSYLIPNNIKPADAPVRYPFLWNAPKQDKTQWPGFADNGNDILGLSRNLGEVYGVFGVFEPQKDAWHLLLGYNYLNNNSANFDGLGALEGLVKQIGAPKWPWPVDNALAEKGKAIYNWPTAQGGCSECHGIRPGEVRFLNVQTWATTPLQDVGTDTKEYEILQWQVNTGVLEGARIPVITEPLKATDSAFNVLATSVLGSIIQYYLPLAAPAPEANAERLEQFSLKPSLLDLKGAFRAPATPRPQDNLNAKTTQYVYEARVLEGIWATAPYLHNGSVPTLNELLKPSSQRVSAFQVGPAYDTVNIGLAAVQPKSGYTLNTTDCNDRNSGNSRCGHEYGVQLSADDKKALLEYLKTL